MTSTEAIIQKKKKFLLVFPLIAAPFLFFAFYTLGGGQSDPGKGAAERAAGMGFNTELPAPVFHQKDGGMNKMTAYEQARKDSMRRREALRQDPYRSGSAGSTPDPVKGNWLSGSYNPMNAQVSAGSHLNTRLRPEDAKADELLTKLKALEKSVAQPERVIPVSKPEAIVRPGNKPVPDLPSLPIDHAVTLSRPEPPRPDPELDRLSEMLDKIVAIQKSEVPGQEMEKNPGPAEEAGVRSGTNQKKLADTHEGSGTVPAASATIPAVVQGDQEMVTGATIALRLTEEIMIGGVIVPRDQRVYGQVSINNDRMMVHISSIRSGQSIYPLSLKLYDLDGLEGIHIPDMLSRQVARQSADQGIGSLNLGAYDPSIGGQATNAGIQAAKSLFSRKVRLVRVSVRDGYQVLLKDTKGSVIVVVPRDTVATDRKDSVKMEIRAPSVDSLEPFMHHSQKEGKIRLTLRGIYFREGLMWLSFQCENRGRIGYAPDHLRCTIHEGRRLKRTAMQEISLEPVCRQLPPEIPMDSSGTMLLGFRPFTLGKGKKLLVELGERDGGRGLAMEIGPKVLLEAK